MPSDAELDAALQVVRNEEVPATAEEKEQYFIQNLAVGEQLASQGTYTFQVPLRYLSHS
jgi:import receptor subunit TOM20